MKDYLQNFQVYLTSEKKASKNTLESYLRDVKRFAEYLSINDIGSVTEVDESVFKNYMKSLQKLGKSPATVTRTMASLRCYYAFLLSAGMMADNPVSSVKNAKVEKKLPEILTNKEVELLLAQPDCSELKGCRDKAMLELLYATGIRVSELITIRLGDVDLQLGMLHLKSSKNVRTIPMYPEAIKCVANYCKKVRDIVVSDKSVTQLFTNMNGQPMTRQGFWKIIKQYAESAQIEKDITPHTLRHSFAAHLLENGAPLKDIKDILGHTDISSTQIYAQIMKSRYAQSYKKYHPMAH